MAMLLVSIMPPGRLGRLRHGGAAALIGDARAARDRERIVACRAAAANARSRRMCARFGFAEDPVHEMLPSRIVGRPARYVWLDGAAQALSSRP
jgi:hypothetical protein